MALFCPLSHVHVLAPCQPLRTRGDVPLLDVHEYMPLSFVETIS